MSAFDRKSNTERERKGYWTTRTLSMNHRQRGNDLAASGMSQTRQARSVLQERDSNSQATVAQAVYTNNLCRIFQTARMKRFVQESHHKRHPHRIAPGQCREVEA